MEHLQERRRKVLAAMESAESPVPLDGILDAWNQGDAQTRRELLQAFFDELDVRDGEIVGYKLRTDKQDEVAALLDPILNGSSESWHALTSLVVNGGFNSLPAHFQQTACAILVARYGFESTEVVPIEHNTNRAAPIEVPALDLSAGP